MKIVTPDYYKDFRCIAGACTDTCCAGWDVDVDENSYRYYKKVKGEFGKRLKSVMVPSEDGGCTFTLNKGRCPFLNDENLCDLYIALGEDKLCETCAEFPRFINEYGSIREIGIAPSCKTAGELILGYKGELTFDMNDSDEEVSSYNDIDPLTYIQLRQARTIAYNIVSDRDYTIAERAVLILMFAKDIQYYLDKEKDELIIGVCRRYAKEDYRERKLDKARSICASRPDAYLYTRRFFDSFKGMEVINPDWNIYVKEVNTFYAMCMCNSSDENNSSDACDSSNIRNGNDKNNNSRQSFMDAVAQFDKYYENNQHEYEQILMYYVYRYFLDAVYDYNVLLKMKGAVVGLLSLKMMDVADWYLNDKKLDFTRQVDLAHLYSRQYEHSYYNYEEYNKFFGYKRRYSYENLIAQLLTME